MIRIFIGLILILSMIGNTIGDSCYCACCKYNPTPSCITTTLHMLSCTNATCADFCRETFPDSCPAPGQPGDFSSACTSSAVGSYHKSIDVAIILASVVAVFLLKLIRNG